LKTILDPCVTLNVTLLRLIAKSLFIHEPAHASWHAKALQKVPCGPGNTNCVQRLEDVG
jgi:hypothetical protein